jgi:hypothetical protein
MLNILENAHHGTYERYVSHIVQQFHDLDDLQDARQYSNVVNAHLKWG